MRLYQSNGLGNRVIGACLVVLFVAWSLSTAMDLLAHAWPGLVIVGAVAAIIAVAVVWFRNRRSGW